jgi:hypothetical protein
MEYEKKSQMQVETLKQYEIKIQSSEMQGSSKFEQIIRMKDEELRMLSSKYSQMESKFMSST